jgi:outer membrane protein assembly factor BamB
MTVRSDSSKRRSKPLGISGGTWRLLIIPVLLIMILPLGVNAMMFRNDTSHTGVYYDIATPPNNVKLWNYSFGGFKYLNATEFTYIMDNSTYASPAVVNGVVYEGSLGNNMTAFYANNGTVIWSVFTDGDIHASPAVDSSRNRVYFTSYDHNLYALNTVNGGTSWTSDIGAPGHSSPAILGNVVYEGSDNGIVYAFNADSGNEIWSNETNSTPVAGGVAIHSSPAVVNGMVYIGNDDGNLYALNATDGITGNWYYTTGGPVKSSPAVVGGVVYFGSNDGKLYAIDAISGTDVTSFPYIGAVGSAIESSPAVGVKSISAVIMVDCMPYPQVLGQ